MPRAWIRIALATALLGASTARAGTDTSSCAGKRTWQSALVADTIRSWLEGTPRPENLLALVQAEQGIAACEQQQRPTLHTAQLPPGLKIPQLGAILLANELEWRGLVPPPEEALAGKTFRVAAPPVPASGAR
jgi:hypothetical protein